MRVGNTPTCVGKTVTHNINYTVIRKHPHLRGEDIALWLHQITFSETPPPAWGRLTHASNTRRLERNTPTCVGKTGLPQFGESWLGKHPHLRGEDSVSGVFWINAWETPPPAWGRPQASAAPSKKHGNTPTCVGKTRV